jgi:lysozyme
LSKELFDQVIRHEGKKNKPYLDTKGKLTIGVGRNLTDRGLSDDEIMFLLTNDLMDCAADLHMAFDWFESLDEVRTDVMLELCFNMGLTTLLEFEKMLAAMARKDYKTAAKELLDSQWRKDVGPTRSNVLANQLRTGKRLLEAKA